MAYKIRKSAAAEKYEANKAAEKAAEKIMTKEQKAASAARVEELRAAAREAHKEALVAFLNSAEVEVAASLRRTIARDKESIAKLANSLLEDAHYELSWLQDEHFRAAVRIKYLGSWARTIELKADAGESFAFRSILDWIRREAVQRASSVSRSTSPASNLMDEAERLVFVKFAEFDEHSFDALRITSYDNYVDAKLSKVAEAIEAWRSGDADAALAALGFKAS